MMPWRVPVSTLDPKCPQESTWGGFYRKWSTAVLSNIKGQEEPQLRCLAPTHLLWYFPSFVGSGSRNRTACLLASPFHCASSCAVWGAEFAQEQCLLPLHISKHLDQQVNEGWGNVLREIAKNRAAVNRSHYSLRCKASGCPWHSLESSLSVCGWIKPCAESKAKSSLCLLVCNQLLSLSFSSSKGSLTNKAKEGLGFSLSNLMEERKSRKKKKFRCCCKLKSLPMITNDVNVWKRSVSLPGPHTCYFTVNTSDEIRWVRSGRPQSKACQDRQAAGTDLTTTELLSLRLCEGHWVSHRNTQDAPESVQLFITAATRDSLHVLLSHPANHLIECPPEPCSPWVWM